MRTGSRLLIVFISVFAAAAGAGLAAGAGRAGTRVQIGHACDPANAVVRGQRDPACWPFARSSPWNTSLGSGAGLAAGGACTRDAGDPNIPADINASQWSIPVYVGRGTDPATAVYTLDGGTAVRYVGSVRAPAGMTPEPPRFPSGDAYLTIVDPTHSTAYEQWQARSFTGSHGAGWLSTYENTTNLYGSGIAQGGPRAFGGSTLGGLIRAWELQTRTIRHALAFSTQYDHQTDAWVWPAISNDGAPRGQYTGHMPMGQLAGIPRRYGLEPDGAFSLALFKQELGLRTSVGTEIALAARDYGAYLVDSSQGFAFYAEPSSAALVAAALNVYDSSGLTDVDKIRSALECVTNSGAATPGGPGARLAPSTPALATSGSNPSHSRRHRKRRHTRRGRHRRHLH